MALGVILGIIMAALGVLFCIWDLLMLLAEDPTSAVICLISDCADKKGFDGTEGFGVYAILILFGIVTIVLSILPAAKDSSPQTRRRTRRR